MAWNADRMKEILLEAGETAQRLKADMRRELKDDLSLVTRADHEIEALFCRSLEDPGRGVYLIGEETVAEKGEEYLHAALKAECFVVDPIDGTAPYAHYLPVWGISVGRMENGVLTDGAVYLPDMGELVLNDGEAILQGIRKGTDWDWSRLDPARIAADEHALVAVTQAVAKRGKVLVPNPVLVLGVAVVPMIGLLQGRFLAYLGSVRLWDLAGALPLLLRSGFGASVRVGDEIREVSLRVEDSTYHLDPGSEKRWALRSDLLICRPEDAPRFRASFTSGET